MSVRVMICFARSGGTVLNQCIGSLSNVVILSEVNPLGGGGGQGPVLFQTVKAQAKEWYQINLQSEDFVGGILELEQICENSGRYLVVRDWSFINFVPHRFNNFDPPGCFLTLEALEGKCSLIPFAFVRDSIDVWISRGTPSVEEFFGQYLYYVKTLLEKKIPIFRYENFCQHPSLVIRNICEYTGLEYSDLYKNYVSFINVNGDVQVSGGSRGVKQGKIKLLPRRRIAKDKIIQVNQCAKMIEVNRLLDYPVSYYDTPRENFSSREFRTRIGKLVRSRWK